MVLHGDIPSALKSAGRCHFHTRCPFVIDRCRSLRPHLIDDAVGHATACHIWPELPRVKAAVAKAAPSPVLERLIAAFRGSKDVRGS